MVNGTDLIAVGLASIGAIAHAVGYVIQKKGHNEVHELNNTPNTTPKGYNTMGTTKHYEFPPPENLSEQKSKSFVTNIVWVFGFAVNYILFSFLLDIYYHCN